jgi:hypothetical protein
MNDTERDLRELFETKAREAGAAPRVTPEVLRRGRRRQVGTVAVAGITALAVAAAAVVSLQALNRADTDSAPGGQQGNPSFTATIQNFRITVPERWTLIDQWPLGENMVVGSSGGTSSVCVGPPVEAGSGQKSPSGTETSDCSRQQTQSSEQTSEQPTIPLGGLPMLTLSNEDPGLDGSVCNAGGTLPATSATLYIGLDFGATRTTGWENTVAAWPHPLVNVLEGDLPVEQMPCGPGGYSWFQTGGAPYIAWAGFGSEVTDADRRTLLDVFDGMQVSDAEITSPTTDVPGYVLTGGTTGSGAGWNLEAYPNDTNVDMAYTEEGGRWGGAGDFGPPLVPIQLASGHGVVFGSVTFEADRVELRPSDGSDPIQGSILRFPGSLGAPFDGFVVPTGAGGEVVAIGPDGDLGSATVEGETAGGQAVPTSTPTSTEPAESSVELQGFASLASLTVRRDSANGCLSIEIATGDDEGAGICAGGPIQPVLADMVALGDGESGVLGYVSPEAGQVYLVSDDGRRFDATILYALSVEPKVQFFAISVPVTSGRLHVADLNGVELMAPIRLSSTP